LSFRGGLFAGKSLKNKRINKRFLAEFTLSANHEANKGDKLIKIKTKYQEKEKW
jgi:hypothetical protein